MRFFPPKLHLWGRKEAPPDSLSSEELESLEGILDHEFKNRSFLVEAFSHASWSHARGLPSNERLEFLGDSVLQLITTEFLFTRQPGLSEGALTQHRSTLVNSKTLSEIAGAIDLDRYALKRLSNRKPNDRERESLLTDMYEAAVGALYLDGGIEAARRFVHRSLLSRSDEITEVGLSTNYKSALLELMQSRGEDEPIYANRREEGPPHARVFNVDVLLNSKVAGSGSGTRLKEAEQAAAHAALKRLSDENADIE